MKRIFPLLILALILTGCTSYEFQNTDIEKDKSNQSQRYHEIKTSLTSDKVDDIINFSTVVPEEMKKLQQKGEIFGYDENRKISSRTSMNQLMPVYDCKDGKDNCSLIQLTSSGEKLNQDFSSCDPNGFCTITGQDLPKNFKNIAAFAYYSNGDLYTIDRDAIDENKYIIYKNNKELFAREMKFGASSVIEEAGIVLNFPAFTFYDLKSKLFKDDFNRNIWYNNETINEKYSIEGSSHLFSYLDKVGFVGEKHGKKFIFFNGQKISRDFDEIRTHSCCAIFAYPIELDENGILFFLAQGGNEYFFVEINLNEF